MRRAFRHKQNDHCVQNESNSRGEMQIPFKLFGILAIFIYLCAKQILDDEDNTTNGARGGLALAIRGAGGPTDGTDGRGRNAAGPHRDAGPIQRIYGQQLSALQGAERGGGALRRLPRQLRPAEQ